MIQHKTPTTPSDPSVGMLAGARASWPSRSALAARRVPRPGGPDRPRHDGHDERDPDRRRRAHTGLLTTEGFRDILEMRRGVRSRRHLYDNKYVPPQPLVPRYLRLPVRERIDVRGTVRTPLDDASVAAAVDVLLAEGVESVAICFMHAYANPEHEERVLAVVRERAPGVFLAVSSEILPQVRLNNRVSTTVMSAYVGPVLQRYMERLVAGARRRRPSAAILLVMQSNGGVATPEIVARNPATTVLSGPAGGPGRRARLRARAGLAGLRRRRHGRHELRRLARQGRRGAGHARRRDQPPPDLAADDRRADDRRRRRLDRLARRGRPAAHGAAQRGRRPRPRLLRPRRHRADLHRRRPRARLPRSRLLPRRADAARRGRARGRRSSAGSPGRWASTPSPPRPRWSRSSTSRWPTRTNDVAIQRGYDPRELPLVVAGGAGAVHAGAIAEELGIGDRDRPAASRRCCARSGMLLADLRHDYTRSFPRAWDELRRRRGARRPRRASSSRAWTRSSARASPAERRSVVAAADIRYVGQHHEVTVPFPLDDLADARSASRRPSTAATRSSTGSPRRASRWR